MRHSHHLRFLRSIVLAFAAIASGALALSAGQAPAPATPLPRTVQLTPADAARAAADARKGVSVTVPPGLELKLFASEDLLVDPVALEFDDKGTLYVVSTSRANLPLDIRGHPTWVPTVHTLKTVPDLLNFYKKELAPERSAQNRWIPDLNKDGSNDIRDLAEFKERLYRIQDTNGDGVADASRIMIEGFNADPTYDVVGGILFNEGDLLFGIAPGVWRLKDDNGDGTIDRQIAISEGYSTHPAFAGHGISGLMMGPDGRLYWEVGDIGLDVTDKSGKRWSYPNQGAVLRSDPDGSNFEVYATGIRNLQEFSFDEFGNLISVDNDGDHQGETERVVYIPNGSDSGWRSNWQYGKYTDPKNNRYNVWMDEQLFKPRFDGQAAYIVPPVASYHTGPSGMAYNPGTALSDEWRNTFFVTSFPGAASNARIYGFKLKEDGAGFALDSDRVLLQGILAIGLKFGPDGALYLTDWITGWQSKNKGRVWALDSPQAASSPVRAEVKKVLGERLDARSAGDVASLLRHADMRVRQKAQFELVRRGDIQSLTTASGDAQSRLARIHGIWGIAQLARKNDSHAAGARAPAEGWRRRDPRAVGEDARRRALRARGGAAHAAARRIARRACASSPRKPSGASRTSRRCRRSSRCSPPTTTRTYCCGTRGASRCRASARRTPSPASRPHTSRGVRIAAVIALRRMRNAGVARFLTDADESVVLEAARAINDDGSIDGALPALARVLDDKRFTKEPLVRRAISASLKVGAPDAAARLSAFAADPKNARAMRVEAVAALGVWASPSTMDRVDGIYIGQPPARDPAVARDAILKMLQAAEADDSMKIALAEAAGRLSLQEAAPILLTQLKKRSLRRCQGRRAARPRSAQAIEHQRDHEGGDWRREPRGASRRGRDSSVAAARRSGESTEPRRRHPRRHGERSAGGSRRARGHEVARGSERARDRSSTSSPRGSSRARCTPISSTRCRPADRRRSRTSSRPTGNRSQPTAWRRRSGSRCCLEAIRAGRSKSSQSIRRRHASGATRSARTAARTSARTSRGSGPASRASSSSNRCSSRTRGSRRATEPSASR